MWGLGSHLSISRWRRLAILKDRRGTSQKLVVWVTGDVTGSGLFFFLLPLLPDFPFLPLEDFFPFFTFGGDFFPFFTFGGDFFPFLDFFLSFSSFKASWKSKDSSDERSPPLSELVSEEPSNSPSTSVQYVEPFNRFLNLVSTNHSGQGAPTSTVTAPTPFSFSFSKTINRFISSDCSIIYRSLGPAYFFSLREKSLFLFFRLPPTKTWSTSYNFLFLFDDGDFNLSRYIRLLRKNEVVTLSNTSLLFPVAPLTTSIALGLSNPVFSQGHTSSGLTDCWP